MIILNKIEVNVLAEIDLLDALNKKYPIGFINGKVIYCVHNKINGKNYIGQAMNFRNRFSDSYIGHFRDYDLFKEGKKKGKKILYNAWLKYGLDAFILYTIDTGKDREELNEKEVSWIKTLHTCTEDVECYGYNLTWGGEDVNLGSPESIQKSLAARIKKFGSAVSPKCHTPEALAKGTQTKKERYGEDCSPFINANTPEAIEKAKRTKIERYGNSSGFQRDKYEAWQQKNLELYGNKNGDPELRKIKDFNRRITLCFQRINMVLSTNEVLTLESYKKLVTKTYRSRNVERSLKYHLDVVVDLFDTLKLDKRWTAQMAQIFGDTKEELIKALKL